MSADHTPGPWICRGEQVWSAYEVMYIAAANFDCISPSQTLEANARLIAEAPELLRLCERSLLALDEDSFPMLREQLRNTIARVEGARMISTNALFDASQATGEVP